MEINKNKILKICNVVWSAGERIKSIYSKKFKIFKKKDFTPVTTADLESERIIIEGLEKIFNKPKIFSEETNFKNQKSIKNFWLVDPLDGTKEFIKKNGEFTVNIALIHEQFPILGVVGAPALNRTYRAYGLATSERREHSNIWQRISAKTIPPDEDGGIVIIL